MVLRASRHFCETGVSPSILVIRLSSLGDVVLATSVPAALKSRFPEARIAFLTKEAFVDVLKNNPNIDRPICLSASESWTRGILGIARRLRAERFDLVIDLQVNPRTLLLCALIGCRKCSRAGRDSLIRHGVVRVKSLLSRRGRHAVQRYLSSVEKSFGPVPALKPQIFITEAEKETGVRFLRYFEGLDKKPIVSLCPGARWKTKLWGADRMSLLAHRLVQAGYGVLVLGGSPDETILEEMKQLCGDLDAVRFYSGDLRSVAALMSQSRCVVSNDSGLMHVAYSVGTPVIAIFGSTTPEFGFYPPDSRSTVISKSFRCKPCDVHGRDECKKGDMRCMASVEVPEVLDAVGATLKGVSSGGLQGTQFRNYSERDSPRIELPRFLLEEAEPELFGHEWSIPELGPIVVRVPNWVGDVVMACPSLAALRRCTQGIRLVAVAHERVADLLENATVVNEVVALNSQMGLGLVRTALALRRSGFSLGIAMPDSFSSAFLLWLGGAKRIVGFRAEMRDAFLSTRLSRKKWSHLSEQYAQLLPRACKIEGRFILTLAPGDMSRAGKLLEGVGISESSPLALVGPGASYGETKRWPEESYTRLVELLKTKAKSQVVLVGNAADKELCAGIAEKSGRSTADLSGQTTLRDLAAIASIASVFVGNDSGAAHVAAAAGCPVVVIFGSSDPSWTAPRGEDVKVVYKKLSCSPCFLKKCPYELQCLSQIEPDEVYRAVVEVTKQERLDKHGGNS